MNAPTENDLLRILLVEDNPTDVLLIEDALEQVRGVKITLTHAKRLDEALSLLHREYFDAVLLDLGLPDSSGLETFARTQSSYPTVPILILSGLDDETLALKAVHEGAQDYLVKGKINSIMLARTVRYAVERKRTVEKLAASEMSYRRLFETAQDGIFLLDAGTGQITDANPFLEKLLGYSTAEFIGKRLWEVGAFRDKAASKAAFQTLQEKGYIRYEDLPLATKDGRKINVEFVSNVYAENGHQVIQCNIRDISERKRAEMAELESKRFLQSTLDALSSHIAVLDESGTIIAVNRAWERFAEENDASPATCSVGANYLEACDQAKGDWLDGAAEAARGMREVIAGERPVFRLEYPCHSPTEQRWFNLRVTRFDNTTPVRVVVAHENTTARKRAENLISVSEANLAKSQEMAHLGSWELDLTNLDDININPLRWSDEIFRMLGYKPREIEPSNEAFFRAVHPDDRETLSRMMAEAVQGGKSYSVNHRIIWPDGTEHIIHAQSELIYSEETGLPLKMVGLGQDITERKQVEQELQASEARKSAILETALDCIIGIDAQSRILEWNPASEKIFGYARDEVMGKLLPELIIPESLRAAHLDGIENYLATGEGSLLGQRVEVPALRKSGEEFSVELAVTRIEGEAAPVFIAYLRDITERKQAEETLRASEERFQSIVANVPGMVYQFILQPDGTIEWPFVSEGCRELYQMEPDEMQRNPNAVIESIHPDDRAEFERSVLVSAQTLLPWTWEGRHRFGSGQIKWAQGAARPHRLPNGGTLWNGLVMDITARKEAEAERDRFFTLSLDMLAIADHNGYFKRLNPAFEATLGHSNAELMAKPFLEWVHPDDRAATLEVMKKLDAGASTLNFVNRYRCSDGSYRWLSWVSSPFEGLIYAAAHDVTSLKNAQAALHKANDELELHVHERTAELSLANAQLQSEIIERRRVDEALYKNHEFLQAVLENTAEGIVACDAEGNLNFFNRATRDFHGLPLEPLPAEAWSEYYSLYAPDGVTPMRQEDVPLFRALDGEHVRDQEMVITARNGSTRLVTNNGEPLFDAHGTTLGAVVVMHDITERKQAEVKLQRARQEAETANAAKSEFLSRMSHELRTPLNAILGFGQILDRQELSPLNKESVEHILTGGRHLLTLINEVLDISRVESGSLEVALGPIALADIVDSVCALTRPLAEERKLHFTEDASSFCDCYVIANDLRLRQVLLNLLSNAIKYNREGGEVEIFCTSKPENRLAISVRDTGLGIAPEDLPKLFTPFERLGANNLGIEGTGLGLALAQQMVNAMGGTLNVESVVGSGSTFTLELPQAAPAAGTKEPSDDTHEEHSAPFAERHYSVLCIEDNPASLRLMETIFEGRPDITLLSATQGSSGLELALRHEPDLILLDLDLPDMHGNEVLARLQRSAVTRDIAVVIISIDTTPEQQEKLLSAGAKAYLAKPIDVDLLLPTLDKILKETA